MQNPFQVGGQYRNRDGEYEIVELGESHMVIRYADGRTVETSVELQARISANMGAERAFRKEAAAQRASRSGHRAPQKRIGFDGLKEGDFQRGTAGTTWRARTSLGGLLAQRLSAETRQRFQSYAIFRRAELHIARPERYHDHDKKATQQAKFVFELDTDGALYGLYIEKNSGPMDGTWHWPALMTALDGDPALQQSTMQAMRRQGLQWEVYANPADRRMAQVAAGEEGLRWVPDEGEEIAIDWPEFVQRLSQIDEGQWCNLYLCARMPQAEAIAAGAGIADAAVKAYRGLLPLYKAATEGSGSKG